MPQPRVSIRIGTDGKATVVKDFADIGDAGDAQSKRIAMAFQRDSALAEAAIEKLNKTAQRAAAIGPGGSGATNLINPVTGGSYAQADGAAQVSARAMQQQFSAAEASAQRLLASVDPLYAAQQRYNVALEEAQVAYRAGALSAEQYAQIQTGLKAQLDGQSAALGNFRNASGGARIAQMEVMGAARGMTDALAMGMPITRAVSMEIGRLTEAAALMGGGLGAVGTFLSGGWGIALMVGTVALAPFLGKIFDTSNALDTAVGKLKKEAEQQQTNAAANDAFAATQEGVEAALRASTTALDKLADGHKSAAEQALIDAFKTEEYARKVLAATQANLDYARSIYEVQKASASGMGHQAETAIFSLQQSESQLDGLQASVDQAKADLAAADEKIRVATLNVYSEAAQKDPAQLIKDRYQTLIDQATKRAIAEHKTGDELQRQIALLKQQRDAAVEAQNARDSAGGTGSSVTGGGAPTMTVQQAQLASLFDLANKYRGLSETGDRSELQRLLGGVDPEKTAWCAAFINAMLAMAGIRGTGSLAAASFLNFGKDDMASPQKGDIVIIKGAAGDHVGLLDKVNANGSVSVLGGNTHNQVAEATYSASSILGIRTPPTAGQQAADDLKAQETLNTLLTEQMAKEAEVTLNKGEQVNFVEQYNRGTGTSLEQLAKMLPGLENWNKQYDRLIASQQELNQFGDQALETIFNPDNWSNWGDLGKQVLHEIEAEFVKLALLNPIKNLLMGENNPTLSSLFASIGGAFGGGGKTLNIDLPLGYASGTDYAPGGLSWVGEFGKELVRLPRGSKVFPADESRRMAANDGGIGALHFNFNVDATGADSAAVGRLNAKLDQLQQALPSIVVASFQDARQRGVIR